MVDTVKMPVQQQQAYLKVLGFDIGKEGLDGKAGQNSVTQKALNDFAKSNGINPKDTEKINQALLKAVQGTPQSRAFLDKVQNDISGGGASPDDVKALQWVLKGNGAGMPLSTRGDKMDGIPGAETRTTLKTFVDSPSLPEFVHKFRPNNFPDLSDPDKIPSKIAPAINPALQKFYDSLSPEQREIQRKIAMLGGSQSHGETLGLAPWAVESYFHGKTISGNIYDGGFPVSRKKGNYFEPYEPSERVTRLMEEFDKSLTPEQRKLREKYVESEPEPDVKGPFEKRRREYFDPETLTDPSPRTRRLKEEITERDPLRLLESGEAKKGDPLGRYDVLDHGRIRTGIDLSEAFRQSTSSLIGAPGSPSVEPDLGRDEKLQRAPLVKPVGLDM